MTTAACLPRITVLPVRFFLRLFALLALVPAAFSLTYVSSCSVLSTPGEQYVLTQNISFSSGNCMSIAANGITLDCNGYAITGSGSGNTGIYASHSNGSTIRNCNVLNCTSLKFVSVGNSNVSNFRGFGFAVDIENSSNNTFTNIISSSVDACALCVTSGSRSNTFINANLSDPWLGIWLIEDAVDTRFYNCTNGLQYDNASGFFFPQYYSDSPSNTTSSGNTGWWPLLDSDGSSVTSISQTAWYNGTEGGRNADGTTNSSLHYWYNNQGGPPADSEAPALAIQSPINATYNSSSVPLNFTVSDTGSGVSFCWYSLDGGSNTSLPSCGNASLSPLSQGSHTLIVYANDSAGNYNSSSVSFSIDTIQPSVSIQSPANATYNSSSVRLNFTVSDSGSGIDSCWHKLDSGANTTLPGCGNTTLNALGDGAHTITVYANDSAGNTAPTTVFFTVNALKTRIRVSIRNQDLRPSYLNGISLNGDYAPFDPPISFAPGERKTITFSLTEGYCGYAGQLVQFDVVILYYQQGQISGMAQAGSIPLMAKCS